MPASPRGVALSRIHVQAWSLTSEAVTLSLGKRIWERGSCDHSTASAAMMDNGYIMSVERRRRESSPVVSGSQSWNED